MGLSWTAFAVFIFVFLTSPSLPGNISSTTAIFHFPLGESGSSISETRSSPLSFSLFRCHLFLGSRSDAKYFNQQCQNYFTRFSMLLTRSLVFNTKDYLELENLENIWIASFDLIVGVTHKPPRYSSGDFLDEFGNILHTVYLSGKKSGYKWFRYQHT